MVLVCSAVGDGFLRAQRLPSWPRLSSQRLSFSLLPCMTPARLVETAEKHSIENAVQYMDMPCFMVWICQKARATMLTITGCEPGVPGGRSTAWSARVAVNSIAQDHLGRSRYDRRTPFPWAPPEQHGLMDTATRMDSASSEEMAHLRALHRYTPCPTTRSASCWKRHGSSPSPAAGCCSSRATPTMNTSIC